MINARPSYVIEKVTMCNGKEWRLMHLPASRLCGAIIGHYKSLKAATTSARLLAGRSADVLYFKDKTK